MKIQHLGSFQGTTAPVTQNAKSILSARPAAAASGVDRAVDSAPPLEGEQLRRRIEAFEGRIGRRFEALLGRSDLTADQRAALEDAQRHLHGMLRRFDHALDDGAASSVMENVLAHVRDTVSSIFEPQPDAPERPGRVGGTGFRVDAQAGDSNTRQIDTLA
jgi:hypothetical protein